jgi:hypothetical protein
MPKNGLKEAKVLRNDLRPNQHYEHGEGSDDLR